MKMKKTMTLKGTSMNDFLSESEKERVKEQMRRVALGLLFWSFVFVIFSLIWYVTVGDTYNAHIYFGLFMVTWFFGTFITISYLMDIEPTEEVLRHKK